MTEYLSGLDVDHNSEEVYSDEVFIDEGSSEFDVTPIPQHQGVDF